jgi:cytochrome P450
VHAALVEELERELKGAPPTLEQLERLPLLDRVVKESLRLLPPVPTAFRTSTAPFEMGGHRFEAETRLYYSPYITHRLPDLYPEPKRFLPERWLKEEPPVYGYIPFSNGPRRCIGATLALLEMKLLLSMLLQRFRLSVPPGTRVEPWVRATIQPKGGLPMRLHTRDERLERPEVRGRIHELVALA